MPFIHKNQEISSTINEIVSEIEAVIRSFNTSKISPDFSYPESNYDEYQKENIIKTWNRITDIYNNAKKIHELDPKFGRIQRILRITIELTRRFPELISAVILKSYIEAILNKPKLGFKDYQNILEKIISTSDFFNFALASYISGEFDISRICLERYFRRVGKINNFDLWVIYVFLCIKTSTNTFAINWEDFEDVNYSYSEFQILFKVGIYYLLENKERDLAIKLLQKYLDDEEIDNIVELTYKNIFSTLKPSYKVPEGPIKGKLISFDKNEGSGIIQNEEGREFLFDLNDIKNPKLEDFINENEIVKQIPITFEINETKFILKAANILLDSDEKLEINSNKDLKPGYVYAYNVSDGYGFIEDAEGVEYFFNISNIQDQSLKFNLQAYIKNQKIPVFFKKDNGPRGLRALQIYLDKTREYRSLWQFPQKLRGEIYSYKHYGNYGFLRSSDGIEYFFHQSAIIDTELLDLVGEWEWPKTYPVFFEIGSKASGKKNPLAIKLSLYHEIDEMFKEANNYAEEGDYQSALTEIEQVLAYDPDYSTARDLYELWQRYILVPNIPKGKNFYSRAKRAQLLENDDRRAEYLYKNAIEKENNYEESVKELSLIYARSGDIEKAISFLEKNRQNMKDQQAVDNILINLFTEANLNGKAIEVLNRQINITSKKSSKLRLESQKALYYIKLEQFSKAEDTYKRILKYQPNNTDFKRNLAVSLIGQDRYIEAEDILKGILSKKSDARAEELLKITQDVKVTGESTKFERMIIETTFSGLSSKSSKLVEFLLDRSTFAGVRAERVASGDFTNKDVSQLEDLATRLGTKRPIDRSDYYLSAAKIVSILEEDENSSRFNKYLARSLASRGDAAVILRKPLDIVREFYRESLVAYDYVQNAVREQDAVNAIIRYLSSILGHTNIPMIPDRAPSVSETLNIVFDSHLDPRNILSQISYLTLQSRFAADQILGHLFGNNDLRITTTKFLSNNGITVPRSIRFEKFVELWNELRENSLEKIRVNNNELNLLQRIQFSTSSIENSIKSLNNLNIFLSIDQQRVQQLENIFEMILDMLKEVSFEEQERLCVLINNRCTDLINEIEENPTGFAVEHLYPIINIIQQKAEDYIDELYRSSVPHLSLRLAVDTYTPGKDNNLDIQVTVENQAGSSPVDNLQVITLAQELENMFELKEANISHEGSLRGGDQRIFHIPISITNKALMSKTFSMSIYAQYRMRSGDIKETPVSDFSIRLYSSDEYEEIDNPYATYAEGGPVNDLNMFYGRGDLINRTAQTIRGSSKQSKSIVIYGQKRAGKSSVLYHLQQELRKSPNIMILDLGNIGSIIDPNSKIHFLYQILWKILNELEYAIEDKVEEGYSNIELEIPGSLEFYEHPTPLIFFNEIFDRFQRKTSRKDDWKEVKPVLLIDEFSYIYGQIVNRSIPDTFMKNWKALLQKNYFSAVLAGQDVMPKFKQKFPNEFGTSQDERISYLMPEDAIRLIDEPIRIKGKKDESRYREQAIQRILELTAGSPFYIQIFCNRLVDYMNRNKAIYVTEADVEYITHELIRGVNALGKDKFENLYNSGDTSQDSISDEDSMKVLSEIAINSRLGLCHHSKIVCNTDNSIDDILNDLVNREVIERSNRDYFRIRIQLFNEWLIANQ